MHFIVYNKSSLTLLQVHTYLLGLVKCMIFMINFNVGNLWWNLSTSRIIVKKLVIINNRTTDMKQLHKIIDEGAIWIINYWHVRFYTVKTVAFIAGKNRKSSSPKKFIRFSIDNLIANISLYALSWPKLNFGCYLTFEIIF